MEYLGKLMKTTPIESLSEFIRFLAFFYERNYKRIVKK